MSLLLGGNVAYAKGGSAFSTSGSYKSQPSVVLDLEEDGELDKKKSKKNKGKKF
jgi:hypothetical protein